VNEAVLTFAQAPVHHLEN